MAAKLVDTKPRAKVVGTLDNGALPAAGSVLWAAHAGDSRAVLARGRRAVRLTEDHKPCLPAERLRVEANGGRVQLGRGQRCW